MARIEYGSAESMEDEITTIVRALRAWADRETKRADEAEERVKELEGELGDAKARITELEAANGD